MVGYRNQHYVPKCLLKGFINFENGKSSLVLYNINSGDMKIRNLRKTFSSRRFYDVLSDENESYFEHILGDNENKSGVILDKLRDDPMKINELSDDEILILWKFIWLTKLRTPIGKIQFVNMFLDLGGFNRDKISDDDKCLNFNQFMSNCSIETVYSIVDFIMIPYWLGRSLSFNDYDLVLSSSDSVDLVISDDPVVLLYDDNLFRELYLPISRYLYMSFRLKSNIVGSKLKYLTWDKAKFLNKCQYDDRDTFIVHGVNKGFKNYLRKNVILSSEKLSLF